MFSVQWLKINDNFRLLITYIGTNDKKKLFVFVFLYFAFIYLLAADVQWYLMVIIDRFALLID